MSADNFWSWPQIDIRPGRRRGLEGRAGEGAARRWRRAAEGWNRSEAREIGPGAIVNPRGGVGRKSPNHFRGLPIITF